MAILCRWPGRYAAMIRDALSGAGIPHYVVGGLPLLATPAGRSAALLLGLIGGALDARRVMDWVHSGGADLEGVDPGAGSVLSLWDRIVREGGVRSGRDDILRAIDRFQRFRVYRPQALAYARAIREILGAPPREVVLLFVRAGVERRLGGEDARCAR